MDILWAPWRLSFIKKKKGKGCFLCRIAKETKKDKKNYVFLRSKNAYAVFNIYPYNNGHCLIVTKRHVGDINKLSTQELLELFDILKKVKTRLKKLLKPHGYNIGINIGKAAGAGAPNHLHIHLVPRWQADTNFMPITSNTKIMPQTLDELYKLLKFK